MTFAAVGSLVHEQNSASVTLDPQNVGDFILLHSVNKDNTDGLQGVSGGGCTWGNASG